MSKESKEVIQKANEVFKKFQKEAGDAAKRVGPLDGELAKKIHKTSQDAAEVVKHIEQKSG